MTRLRETAREVGVRVERRIRAEIREIREIAWSVASGQTTRLRFFSRVVPLLIELVLLAFFFGFTVNILIFVFSRHVNGLGFSICVTTLVFKRGFLAIISTTILFLGFLAIGLVAIAGGLAALSSAAFPPSGPFPGSGAARAREAARD